MNVLLLLYTYIDGNIGGTNMRIGESFIPGGVTHTLGRNDRGVTPTGESFIPLTPYPYRRHNGSLVYSKEDEAEGERCQNPHAVSLLSMYVRVCVYYCSRDDLNGL